MIYQMIYGKNPSLGYRELKYSAGIMMEEYFDNRLFDAFKVKFGLSEDNYDDIGNLPKCVYFFSSDSGNNAICAVGEISQEERDGEITYLSHFYIFTPPDFADAIAANTQSSVFNLKPFVQKYGNIQSYDINSNKIYNSDNTFSIETIKSSLESAGINKNLFKVVLHKLFLAVQYDKKIYIVSPKNTGEFTKSMLSLIRGIFYIFPSSFLNNFGFITYLRYISDNEMLYKSTKIAVVEDNEKNRSEYSDLLDDGNFIVDFENDSDNEYYGKSMLLDLMASVIFNNEYNYILTEFYEHTKKYLKKSSLKDYDMYELLYRHYAVVSNRPEKDSIKNIYNELLEYVDKLHDSIFKEVSIETIDALKESIENVVFEPKKIEGLMNIFVKLKTISNYSVDMLIDEDFLAFLQNKLKQAFDSSDYLLLKEYYELSTKLESDLLNETAADNLKNIKQEIINNIFVTIKSHTMTIDEKMLIENWSDEQISLLNEINKKKIFDVLISKSLNLALCEPIVFNKLLSDFKNEIRSSGYLQTRLVEYKEALTASYQSCVDAKEIRIYFQIFAIIFDNNIELFKIIFDKDGLYELLLYIKILDDKASSEDLNFIGEVLENFNSSKMKKDVKAFFADENYKYELEKASRIDKNVELFAKKYKVFDSGKKGWFSKG